MASLLYIIHTTKYDYTTKPQAVIQNYFRKHFLELFLGFLQNQPCHLWAHNYTESLKGFEMKPLWVFSDSPRDKNFMGFPYE